MRQDQFIRNRTPPVNPLLLHILTAGRIWACSFGHQFFGWLFNNVCALFAPFPDDVNGHQPHRGLSTFRHSSRASFIIRCTKIPKSDTELYETPTLLVFFRNVPYDVRLGNKVPKRRTVTPRHKLTFSHSEFTQSHFLLSRNSRHVPCRSVTNCDKLRTKRTASRAYLKMVFYRSVISFWQVS